MLPDGAARPGRGAPSLHAPSPNARDRGIRRKLSAVQFGERDRGGERILYRQFVRGKRPGRRGFPSKAYSASLSAVWVQPDPGDTTSTTMSAARGQFRAAFDAAIYRDVGTPERELPIAVLPFDEVRGCRLQSIPACKGRLAWPPQVAWPPQGRCRLLHHPPRRLLAARQRRNELPSSS
jgi:hypothetical protein